MVASLFLTCKHEVGTDKHCLILIRRGELNIHFSEDVKNE